MSLATKGTVQKIGQAKRSFIYQNIEWLAQLDVSDGDRVRARELNCTKDQFRGLAKVNAWRKVETSPSDTHLWQVPDGWDQAVEEAQKRSTFLPCGHRPFKNPRGVDGYTCQQECGRIYTREEIQEVVQS